MDFIAPQRRWGCVWLIPPQFILLFEVLGLVWCVVLYILVFRFSEFAKLRSSQLGFLGI